MVGDLWGITYVRKQKKNKPKNLMEKFNPEMFQFYNLQPENGEAMSE